MRLVGHQTAMGCGGGGGGGDGKDDDCGVHEVEVMKVVQEPVSVVVVVAAVTAEYSVRTKLANKPFPLPFLCEY